MCPGARCCTTTMLLGKLTGSPLSTRERAARPPADAPSATTSKLRREYDNVSAEFLGLRAIGNSSIVEPVPLKKKILATRCWKLKSKLKIGSIMALFMGVTKLKPARTPRVLDEWIGENEKVHEETIRSSALAIQHSKQLVAQSKEILARVEQRPRRNANRKAG